MITDDFSDARVHVYPAMTELTTRSAAFGWLSYSDYMERRTERSR